MSALSAADLQRKHDLEGAPDPFPSLNSGDEGAARTSASRTAPTRQSAIDTESEQAFPSLSAAPAPAQKPSAWAAAPRIQPTVTHKHLSTDSFTLPIIDLSTAGRDGKPITLGEIMKQVMGKYKVKVEASSNQRTRQTTFHLKSESVKELEKAKRSLVASLSPVVTSILQAPASTIATIIGPKGATLKQIREQTTVKIDIPRRDEASTPHVNGNGTVPTDLDEDEPTVDITLSGPEPLVQEAKYLLNGIIATKTAKSTQRVRDIPSHILPFVTARRPEYVAAAEGAEVNLALNSADREITVSGDREAVIRIVEKIKATIDTLKTELVSFTMSLPKRQHRLLVGPAVNEIMAASKCGVVVPRPEDPSEEITVWGHGNDLSNGMAAIMQKANSKYIHEFALPGTVAVSKQMVEYMDKIGYAKTLATTHKVQIFPPPAATLENTSGVINVDIVGNKAEVDAAVKDMSSFVASLMGGTSEVDIEWVVHRIVTGKFGKKIKQLSDSHNVRIFFPQESEEKSTVLLVYDPLSPNATKNPAEKANHLNEVQKELKKLAADVADIKSELVPVEKKWHEAVSGPHGTTLNAIIGEDKTLSIKIGAEVGESSEDYILVRGIASDVDRAVKEINRIVENAKNDEIDNSYSVEFEIPQQYVGRIVGSQGGAVNKLRDSLGVKIDFNDEAEEKEKEGGKKKKTVVLKSKVKITGRKENVEDAKKRILGQVERLADETFEVLKIPAQYHSSLIGQNGKYVIRLEEKYAVKITFPREAAENGEGKTREALKPDEVLVKGGKKGVAQAKSELMEAVDYEKESNNSITFTVPTRSVARILGRGGANITEIKNETDAQIDVNRSTEDANTTQITCRGTKKAIAAAKAAILVISDQVGEELDVTMHIENKFHRTIIGAGGQGLRELIVRSGGPADTKAQAGLIRFPRQGEESDEVRLRGDPAVVKKLQAELEKTVATLRDRVVLLCDVPSVQHKALIGRGGQHLNDLQKRTGAQIQFPGSRSYAQMGDAVNAEEFKDANPDDLVKVAGSRKACEAAISEMKASIKHTPSTPTSSERFTATVSVPLKYQHHISQQGQFFRNLRSFGVTVDQSVTAQRPAVPSKPVHGGEAGRIDDDQDYSTGVQWEVVANYQGADEGNSEWTLNARDEAALERAQKMLEEATEQAKGSDKVGFLTLPDRSSFPRIIGSKGANVMRLRAETGTEITVSREDSSIVIVGSDDSIHAAKEAILKIASQRRERD